MKDLVIVGAGDFGKEIAWLVEHINSNGKKYNILGYIDDNKELQGKMLNDYPVIGEVDYLRKLSTEQEIFGVISIQNPVVKKKLADKLEHVIWETLIHPGVIMSRHVEIGKGTVITAGCVISNNAVIGNHCLINLITSVGHDTTIEDYVSVMPGCNLSGFTRLMEGCFLGTGVQTIPKKTVGRYSTVGAGATVVKDIPDYCTAIGSPANPIKYHK